MTPTRLAIAALNDGLRLHRLRTFLTVFGLALGSFSLIVLGWLVTSAEDALARRTTTAVAADVIVIAGEAHDPWQRLRAERWVDETDEAALAERPLLMAQPRALGRVTYGRRAAVGRRSIPVALASVGGDFAHLASYTLASGRWPSAEESGQRVCVIGADVAHELYDTTVEENAPLILDGAIRCRVLGVLRPKAATRIQGLEPSAHPDRRVFVPAAVFRHLVSVPGDVEAELYLGTDGTREGRARVEAAVDLALVGLHHGAHNFELNDDATAKNILRLIVLALEALLVAGALVACIVGGVNVMNAQLVTVATRTREYGLQRALGMSRRTLARVVLLESLFLALLGAGLGIGSGTLFAAASSALLRAAVGSWEFRVAPASFALALGTAIVTGLLAGLVPARRAATLQPRECLADA